MDEIMRGRLRAAFLLNGWRTYPAHIQAIATKRDRHHEEAK
jgi:hypothetical protein